MLGFCNLILQQAADKKMKYKNLASQQTFGHSNHSCFVKDLTLNTSPMLSMCSTVVSDKIFRLGLMDMKLKWVNVV